VAGAGLDPLGCDATSRVGRDGDVPAQLDHDGEGEAMLGMVFLLRN
jgi:hypothetical protein